MMIYYLTLACFLGLSAGSQAAPVLLNYHDDYPTEAEVPEPMVFDLVRRLGAQAGEFEINSLLRIENSTQTRDLLQSPEFEYVLTDNLSAEIELPFRGSTLENFKAAIQFTFGRLGGRKQFIHGTQILFERFLHERETQTIATYILGHRLSPTWSYILIAGPSFFWRSARRVELSGVANVALFFNSSREVDIGVELNWTGPQATYQTFRIMPQLHLLFPMDYKIQFGVGLWKSTENPFELTSAFRLIKEYN